MKINIQLVINRAIQLLLIFMFIVNLSDGLFSPILAVFIAGSIAGATLKTVGFSFGLYAIAKSILQVPLARRIDAQKGERDDFYVMVTGSLLTVLYTFGFIFIHTQLQLYILSIIGGIGAAFLMAAYYGIFARHADKGSEGFEWSLFSVGGLTISSAIGAVIGGIFADSFGFNTLFITAGILSVAATVMLLALYPYLDGFRKKVFPNPPRIHKT